MFNYRRKHHALVFDDLGKKYGFIGVTHAPKTWGVNNHKLPQNIEKGKIDSSYILPEPMTDNKTVFGKEKKPMRIGKKNWYWFNKVKKKPYKK